MAYDGCSVQMMDRLIDLTGQVNKRVEELQRLREQSDRLDKLDKLPSSSMRRHRRSRRPAYVGYPRDRITRKGSWAAIPDMMVMLQDPANDHDQLGPVSLSHFEGTKHTCTSSPVCESDATLCEPANTTGNEAARALDGDQSKFSGSASVPGLSPKPMSLMPLMAPLAHSSYSSHSSHSSPSPSSLSGTALTDRKNTRTSNTTNHSRPKTASLSQVPPGPLSYSSPPAAAPLAPPAAGPDVHLSYPSSTSFSYSSFPSPLPPLLSSSQYTNSVAPFLPPPLPASFLSVSSSSSQHKSSSTPVASPPATIKTAHDRKPPPILAGHRKAPKDISSSTYSDSSPPSTPSSAAGILSATHQPEPAYLVHQKRQPTVGPSTSARLLSLQAKASGAVGTDHTFSHTDTDSMPSATLPSSEAPNDILLCASFDGTTARNSHSSHSDRSHSDRSHSNHSPQSHRANGRWRPTSSRSAGSVQSSEPMRRTSPGPMFNPFTRGSRHRHADGVSDAASRSRSTGGPAMNGSSSLNSTSPSSKRTRNSNNRSQRNSYSNGRRVSVSGSNPPPPLTREEFEALPVAIQRKYFSTLERLRFAQGSSSGQVDGIYQHYDAIAALNIQRNRTRQNRTGSDSIATRLRRKRSLRESPFILGSSAADILFYASLPEKIRKREFTREEQVRFARQLRASVILDAADEAIYKIGRRSSLSHRLFAPDTTLHSPTTATFRRRSMDTIYSSDPRLSRRDALGLELGPSSSSITSKRMSGVPESFYDSFRWLEEKEDLDLSLFLDDYHSNLRDQLPSQEKESMPSLRRHLSISKKPFGRPLQDSRAGTSNAGGSSSIVGARPTTKDDVPMKSKAQVQAQSPASLSGNSGGNVPFPSFPVAAANSTSPVPAPMIHGRRKSRTLSLISPRQHASQTSVSTIDPGAAHYQDPEARLKLRVYLASPQKFDEAIEFGFPSTDVLSSGGSNVARTASMTAPSAAAKRRHNTRQSTSNGSNNLRTFLVGDYDDDDDDDDKLESDQGSIPDPESPKTPQLIPEVATGPASTVSGVTGVSGKAPFRPYRLPTDPSSSHRPSDSYAQVPASSREMTLRMTLTRLDLRAGEDQIYGWQQPQYQVQGSNGQHQSQPSYSLKSSSAQNYTPGASSGDVIPSGSSTPKMTLSPGLPTPVPTSTVTYIGGPNGVRPKESIENVFAGIDHWEAVDQEKGVMKRFWNRVRRN